MSLKQQNNRPFLETILVKGHEDDLEATGQAKFSGSAVNLENGQISVFGNVGDDNFADESDVPNLLKFKFVQGTPLSNGQNPGWLTAWSVSEKRLREGLVHRPEEIIGIHGFQPKLPKLSTIAFTSASAIEVLAGQIGEYRIHLAFRSIRNDRDFGRNLEQLTVQATVPEGSDQRTNIYGQLVARINRFSNWNLATPSWGAGEPGNRNIYALALGTSSGAGAGPALQDLAFDGGDNFEPVDGYGVIPIAGNTALQTALIEAVAAGTGIETKNLVPLNPDGTVVTSTDTIDTILLIGTPHMMAQATDNIYAVNTNISESEADFNEQGDTTKLVLSGPVEGDTARNWQIRFEERSFGQWGNPELANESDYLMKERSYIDLNQPLYGGVHIDSHRSHLDNTSSIVGEQQLRTTIITPYNLDTNPPDDATGSFTLSLADLNGNTNTVTKLNAFLAALKTAFPKIDVSFATGTSYVG